MGSASLGGFPDAQRLKHLPGIRETLVRSLGQEDSPGEGKWPPTSVLLQGESHGGRSLVGYSPLGRKEWDMTTKKHSASLYLYKVKAMT